MSFNQTTDIFLHVGGRQVPAELFTSLYSTTQLGQLQGVQGDRVRVRLWLCRRALQQGQPNILTRANGPIVVAAKSGETLFAITSDFTLVDEGDGEHYEGILDLNTIEAGNVLDKKESVTTRMDIELQSVGNEMRLTFQRDFVLYKQKYQGDEAPPTNAGETWPPPGDLASKAQLQALALWMSKVQRGNFVWHNKVTNLWHSVTLTGESGHETIQIGTGYDSPDSVPLVDPFEIAIAGVSPATPPAAGAEFTVTVDSAIAVAWITPGSVVSIGTKGRAQIVGIDGATITLAAIQSDFTSPVVAGDSMLVLQLGGARGLTGATPEITIGEVTTVAPGTPASATITGTAEAPVLDLELPRGDTGATPNVTIGTVTTGEPGTPASASMSGTAENRVLDLTIPRGATGRDGDIASEARLGAVEATSRPLGGVNMVAASSASVSNCGFELRMGISVTTATLCADLYLDALATGVTGVFGTTSATTSDDEHVWSASVYAEALGWLVSNPRTEYTTPCENLIGKRARLAWIVDGTTITCWANGTRLAPINTTQTLAWGRLKAFLTAQQFLGSVGGVALKSAIYNKILTDDELAAYFDYGVAAADRILGGELLGTTWGQVGGYNWDVFERDGHNVVVESSGVSGMANMAFVALALKRATRVTGVISGFAHTAGEAAYFSYSTSSGSGARAVDLISFSGPITQDGATYRITGDGAFEIAVGADTTITVFQLKSGADFIGGLSVANLVATELGCVASYTPDGLSSGGRWRDESANANDATVRDLAKITPLAPRVQQRVIAVTWPTTSIPANGNASVTLTADNAAAIAAIQANDSLTWAPKASLPTGLVLKDQPRCNNNGTVLIPIRNLTAAAISTGAVTGAIIHTIS